MSEQLIIAGFHRSGTSLVCQLLHRAGLFLGDELLGATFSNPNGHFEDAEVVELHERILADNGRTWRVGEHFAPVLADSHLECMRRLVERREARHRLWGFKDPRVCLFLPLWKHLLPRARVLLVYRHFAEATRSLARPRPRRSSSAAAPGRSSGSSGVSRTWPSGCGSCTTRPCSPSPGPTRRTPSRCPWRWCGAASRSCGL